MTDKNDPGVFFEASRTITQERVDAKRGQISESQVLTASYLRWLHNAPDRPTYGNGRFKG
jgi:hypothetical protein